MTRATFLQLTGEDPVDLLGPDWENYIDDFVDGDNEHFHEGHTRGGCWWCKMD